jgi:hypothetical protein
MGRMGLMLLGCWLVLAARATVPLGWNPSPTEYATYVLYAHTNAITATNLNTALVRVNVGTNTMVTVYDLAGGHWYFAVTAALGVVESRPTEALPVEVPEEPEGGMRLIAIQHSINLTNWVDVGFFRLRIP